MVMTRSNVKVGVNVAARSMVYVANEITRLFLDIVSQRGLSLDELTEQLDTITAGLRTWIAGHWLTHAVLELYDPATDELMQCVDLGLAYHAQRDTAERFDTAIDQVRETLGDETLDAAIRYRVVVQLTDGAPSLPGWEATSFRERGHLQRTPLGDVIDTVGIGVELEYWS